MVVSLRNRRTDGARSLVGVIVGPGKRSEAAPAFSLLISGIGGLADDTRLRVPKGTPKFMQAFRNSHTPPYTISIKERT